MVPPMLMILKILEADDGLCEVLKKSGMYGLRRKVKRALLYHRRKKKKRAVPSASSVNRSRSLIIRLSRNNPALELLINVSKKIAMLKSVPSGQAIKAMIRAKTFNEGEMRLKMDNC